MVLSLKKIDENLNCTNRKFLITETRNLTPETIIASQLVVIKDPLSADPCKQKKS
jgi:hypothetical protein